MAQINTTVANLPDNFERCLGADLGALPEMAIPGYPPRDILFDTRFTDAVFEATHDLDRRAMDYFHRVKKLNRQAETLEDL